MFTIHIVTSAATSAPIAIVAKQAGGCTVEELPKENEREAKAAAAREHGGLPSAWSVLRYVGVWNDRIAATTVAKAMNEQRGNP